MLYNEMSESIYKNDELENEVSSDMSYFWYSDAEGLEEVLSESFLKPFWKSSVVIVVSTGD